MSTSASKGNKRTDTYLELKKARESLGVALDSLATARDALAAVQRALGHIKQAARSAEATKLDWEEKGQPRSLVKRDALPAGIRRKILGAGSQGRGSDG